MSIFSKLKTRVSSTKFKVRVIAASFALGIASIAAIATMGGAAAAPSTTPDCDANAAVWCGVTQSGSSISNEIAQVKKVYANGDGHNKYYTIQDMYNYFGMSTSVINGLSTSNVVSGYVTGDASGDVYATVNGQNTLVATGAITAGRQNISGSTTVKYGATTFYARPTHVSFQNGELAALIIMKDGVFQNAILESCGNPVKATPKKPSYSITKQVRAGTSGSYGSNVSVKSGSTVQYQIAVKSTGAIPVQNVTVHDTLPSGITYASGTLQENGKAVSSADAGKFFAAGLNVGTIKNGATDTFTFQAKAGTVADTDSSCKAASLTNTGYVAAPGLSTLTGTAKVSTTCAPPAALACTSLTAVADTADATGNQKYTFTAKSSAQNVTISSYHFNFGDTNTTTVNSNATSITTTHTYAPGNYTASFAVTGTDADTGKSYTSSSCTYSVTVNQPPKPAYAIKKEVSTSATGTYSSNVQVKSGATVYYKITVSSTGDAPVTNVNVKDALPSDVKYASGTLQQDGKAVSASDASNFFGNGLNVTSIKNGSSTVFTYSAVAGNTSTDTDPSCKAETLDNTGTISTANLSNEQSSAEVKTTCTQLPGTLACVALQAVAGKADSSTGNQPYTFSATATANNATVKTYAFTVTDATGKTVSLPGTLSSNGLSATSATQSFAPGTYTASVAVAGTDNYGNKVQAPANNDCSKTFTVAPPECKPGVQAGSSDCFVYTCNAFTVSVENDTRKVTVTSFSATSSNTNVATPGNVTINWGDGNSSTVALADVTAQNHVFTADSSTITATEQFTAPDGSSSVTSTACSQPVSFTMTPPPVLPNTGAGDVIGIFVGTVATATIGARLFLARKLARR